VGGEEQELVRKGIELAKRGDVQMLKFLLSRILPRERAITINLPKMEFADDAVEALGSIVRAVSVGSISPSEGAALATLVDSYVAAINMADVVKRIDALEAKIRGKVAAQAASSEQNGSAPNAEDTGIQVTFVRAKTPEERQDRLK
jgi:hypothetical protein